jgi:hypothetical protein
MSKKNDQVLGMDEKTVLTVIAIGILGAALLQPMLIGGALAKLKEKVIGR